jgi:hypothetical protein
MDAWTKASAVVEFMMHTFRGDGRADTPAIMEVVQSYLTANNEAAVVEITGPRGVGRQVETRCLMKLTSFHYFVIIIIL